MDRSCPAMKKFALMACVLVLLAGCERKQPPPPDTTAPETLPEAKPAPAAESMPAPTGQPAEMTPLAQSMTQTETPPVVPMDQMTGSGILGLGVNVADSAKTGQSVAQQQQPQQEQPAVSEQTAPQPPKQEAAIP